MSSDGALCIAFHRGFSDFFWIGGQIGIALRLFEKHPQKVSSGEQFEGSWDSSIISVKFLGFFWAGGALEIGLRLFEELPQKFCPRGQFGSFRDLSRISSRFLGFFVDRRPMWGRTEVI